eukprot:TRINITY_DN3362_c0_g1_i1.p1 TRINITY_DN3362_c0_g1~~TRINITY_DN3362_c0_g1_i1.p1  ORF type:complete len:273 (+),score=71.74 TRINITY_DN3362_c0_g1_i1:86-820(+)
MERADSGLGEEVGAGEPGRYMTISRWFKPEDASMLFDVQKTLLENRGRLTAVIPNPETPGPRCHVWYDVALVAPRVMQVSYNCVGEFVASSVKGIQLPGNLTGVSWSEGSMTELLQDKSGGVDHEAVGTVLSWGYSKAALTKRRSFLRVQADGECVFAFSMNHYGGVIEFRNSSQGKWICTEYQMCDEVVQTDELKQTPQVQQELREVEEAASREMKVDAPIGRGRRERSLAKMFHSSSGACAQ